MWYEFRAWNSETLYGWSDDDAVITAAVEWLNRRREINAYAAYPISDEKAAELGLEGLPLVCTTDSRVADFAAEDDAED